MAKKRLLITGVSGLLGSNLAFALCKRYEIIGVYNNHAVIVNDCQALKADLCDAQGVRSLLRDVRPEIIIHGAALADVDLCEQQPQEARKLNVEATQHLVDDLKDRGIKFVYVSSDLVYSGEHAPSHEDDILSPRNQYALTKLEGEHVAIKLQGALALRTNFFGWGLFNDKRSLAQWLINELAAGRPVKGFTDAIFSSIYTMDLALLLERLLQSNVCGVYNLGSRTAMSKYEFLVSVARNLGLDDTLIEPVSMDSLPVRTPRSKNLCLDVTKLQSVAGDVPTMEQTIKHFACDYREGMGQALLLAIRPL